MMPASSSAPASRSDKWRAASMASAIFPACQSETTPSINDGAGLARVRVPMAAPNDRRVALSGPDLHARSWLRAHNVLLRNLKDAAYGPPMPPFGPFAALRIGPPPIPPVCLPSGLVVLVRQPARAPASARAASNWSNRRI